jgi:hypothetical protein
MGVLQFPTPIPMTNGNYPALKFAVFTDSLPTVTMAGYLNQSNIDSATPLSNGDVVMALYSFNTTTLSGSFAILTVNISASNGQITLTAWGNPGDVVLPTTSNYIAHFTNTTGTLSSAADNVTNPGNIAAGLSGTAGTVSSFPGTAAKGSLILAAVANTGNTTTTISNAAMGQASVISIPDPANALGEFLIGATATPFVSGNFPQNSGTAGLMVDSGVSVASLSSAVTQLGQLFQVSVTFNTAQMVTAFDTPLTIVANPSASQMILVLQASVYTASTGHTPYATGTAPIIQYSTGGTNGQHGAGTIATAAGLVAGDITAATSQVRNLFGIATGAQTGLSGKGLYFSNATGDYTAGTGTNITITVVYQLLTATV